MLLAVVRASDSSAMSPVLPASQRLVTWRDRCAVFLLTVLAEIWKAAWKVVCLCSYQRFHHFGETTVSCQKAPPNSKCLQNLGVCFCKFFSGSSGYAVTTFTGVLPKMGSGKSVLLVIHGLWEIGDTCHKVGALSRNGDIASVTGTHGRQTVLGRLIVLLWNEGKHVTLKQFFSAEKSDEILTGDYSVPQQNSASPQNSPTQSTRLLNTFPLSKAI